MRTITCLPNNTSLELRLHSPRISGEEITPVSADIDPGSLASLEPSEPFDLIFLDANKDAYPKYLDLILSKSQPGSPNRLLKPGGLIVADNVLGMAIVADATPTNPHYAEAVARLGEKHVQGLNEALHQFNDKLVAEPRLEAFLVPLFDGLGLARLTD